MSIKQPYGFIWNISDINQICMQARLFANELSNVYYSQLCELIVLMAAKFRTRDIEAGSKLACEKDYLDRACDFITYTIPEWAYVRFKALSVKTSLFVIPRHGKLLGILRAVNSDAWDIWQKKDFISLYPCVTSTDKPDDLSQDEWEQRIFDWDLPIDYEIGSFEITCHGQHADWPTAKMAIGEGRLDAFRKYYGKHQITKGDDACV